MRGDVHELKALKGSRGHEQRGVRYGVIVQGDDLLLSTLLVAPTSRSATETDFRPEVQVRGQRTRVLAEQTRAVDPHRLGELVGHLTHDEMTAVNDALREVLGLDD